MPVFNSPAKTFLDSAEAICPAFFAWLDIAGLPIRATTYRQSITIAASGDAEFDGEYLAFDPRVVEIGEVANREGGSETLTCRLSGLILPDEELLETIGDRANWQGRTARLWVQLRDPDGTVQGLAAAYYTGYMAALDIELSAEAQTIALKIENYLAVFGQPSNRTYLNQKDYDSGDLSAQATIGAASAPRSGPAALVGVGAGNGSAVYKSDFPRLQRQ